MRFPGNVVTEEDTRAKGAGTPDKCFYCSGQRGGQHKAACVVLQRPVKLSVTIDLVVAVPRFWSQETIQHHFNDSSWCADNILTAIERHQKATECLCDSTRIEYRGEATLEEAEADGLVAEC